MAAAMGREVRHLVLSRALLSTPEYGLSGYPSHVPGSDWLATSVFRQTGRYENGYPVLRHVKDDIYPSFDDPFFQFRTEDNAPWLNEAEREAINANHRKANVHRRSVMRSYDWGYWNAIHDAEERVAAEEPVLRKRYEEPNVPFDIAQGGWLPNGATANGSQVVDDLAYRQELRAAGKYEEADTVRRVVESGCVRVRDMPDGTMWFYA